jgi:putative transposase
MLDSVEFVLKELSYKWGCTLVEFGGEEDHVHLLVDAHPNLNLSDFVKNLKSVSSRRMRKQYAEEIKNDLWGGEFWSDGTTIITVGGRASLEKLIPYIQNQKKTR